MSNSSNEVSIIGYHTQENRGIVLTKPLICTRNNAWLGQGYYFWDNLDFAHKWGKQSKKDKYNIYSATLDISNCLDAEYSRADRAFFEKALKDIIEQLNKENKHFDKKVIYNLLVNKFLVPLNVTGIIYGDAPVDPEYIDLKPVCVTKRVQIVIFSQFSSTTISNFELYV